VTEAVISLDRSCAAPREARLRVRHTDLVAPDRIADAELLVSELVTNAVKYGPEEGAIRLIVESDDRRTRFTVHDAGLGPLPEMRAEDDPAPGGHGLRLVDALADRWGVERGSTRVWFEFDR
jgi:anti-sigma regulatory factor (Ser/Thr protein kinase)